jgi:hypothetical protein
MGRNGAQLLTDGPESGDLLSGDLFLHGDSHESRPREERRGSMSISVEPEIGLDNAMTQHVVEVMRSAREELEQLIERRDAIAKRVSAIKQLLNRLKELFGSSVVPETSFVSVEHRGASRVKGLTRACRTVLMESSTPMRAVEGCEELRRRFPELAKRQKELKASVTTVFHRLVCYGEARCFLDAQGLRVWEWNRECEAGELEDSLTLRAAATDAELRS